MVSKKLCCHLKEKCLNTGSCGTVLEGYRAMGRCDLAVEHRLVGWPLRTKPISASGPNASGSAQAPEHKLPETQPKPSYPAFSEKTVLCKL